MEKLVGFVGYECEDVVLYLAKILCCLGKRIAVVDRTEQEMLLEMLEVPKSKETDAREGDFSGVWVTDQGVQKETYDMVFFLFGYRLLHPKMYECEMLVMVTDGVPAHAALLGKLVNWSQKQYLLIRNLVLMKHTEQYLASLAGSEEHYCVIPYDEKDIRMRYSLNSYAECSIKSLSKGMKAALMELLQFLETEYQELMLRKMIRKI